jgi:hypothetical protein
MFKDVPEIFGGQSSTVTSQQKLHGPVPGSPKLFPGLPSPLVSYPKLGPTVTPLAVVAVIELTQIQLPGGKEVGVRVVASQPGPKVGVTEWNQLLAVVLQLLTV